MTLQWSLVLVFAPWAVALTVNALFDRARRKHKSGAASPVWRVITTPYREHVTQDPYYGSTKHIDVTNKVQVRVGKGPDSLVIATVSIDADDFEDLISDAQAVAQTKAASLNAYLGSGS